MKEGLFVFSVLFSVVRRQQKPRREGLTTESTEGTERSWWAVNDTLKREQRTLFSFIP